MATHALADVRATALSLVKKGANRQTFFLRKTAEDEPTLTVATDHRLLKAADDWSVAYVIVAEPGAEEDGGLGAEGIVDVWKSEEEIAAAAHAFEGFVNIGHDTAPADGCRVVESAIALTDFEVDGTTIKKGSWYVGLTLDEPTRELIEKGEITGVSLEGTGVRVPLEKASKHPPLPNKPGATNWVEEAGGLPKYIDEIARAIYWEGSIKGPKGVSRAIRIAVGRVRKWAAGIGVNKDTQAKAAAALAQWEAKKAKANTTVKKEMEAVDRTDDGERTKGALRKIAEHLGLVDELELEPIQKSTTFAERIAERDLTDSLHSAWITLEGVIFDAFRDEDENDPKGQIRQSLDEFRDYLAAKLDATPGEQRVEVAKGLATMESTTEEDQESMGDTDRIKALEDKLGTTESTVADLKKASDTQTEALQEVVKLLKGDGSGGSQQQNGNGNGNGSQAQDGQQTDLQKAVAAIGTIADKMDTLDGELTNLAKAVRTLSEGDTTQGSEGDTLRKSKTDDPLAGLLA